MPLEKLGVGYEIMGVGNLTPKTHNLTPLPKMGVKKESQS